LRKIVLKEKTKMFKSANRNAVQNFHGNVYNDSQKLSVKIKTNILEETSYLVMMKTAYMNTPTSSKVNHCLRADIHGCDNSVRERRNDD
jgi:hypothetical protein